MIITPPQNRQKSLNLALATICLIPISAVSADFNYSGPVNIHGNPHQGISGGIYENVNIFINGVENGYYQDTTEAAVIDGSNLKVTNNITIVNSAQHSKIDNNGAIYAKGGATIDLTGLKSVYLAALPGQEGKNDSTAISAKDKFSSFKAYTNTVKVSAESVQLIGSLDVSPCLGSLISPDYLYSIEVSLDGADSFWYGSAIGDNGVKNVVDVTLSNGATWIFNASGSLLNQDGKLSHLTLDDGIVLLADEKISETYENTVIQGTDYVLADYRDRDAFYSTVELGKLSGAGGTFVMDLNWLTNQGAKSYAADGTSDFLQIEEVESGSHHFIEFDQSRANLDQMKIGDKLYFASVDEGETIFTTSADGEENLANELYTFVYATQSEVDAEDGLTYWYIGKSLGGTNENASLLTSAARAAYSLASDLDRFNERRGQSRRGERGSNGPWVRYRFSSIGIDNAFDMDKHMIQVGYDADVSQTESRKIVGVAFDYTRGETDIDRIDATGDNDRYGLNLYYSVLADCGGYADFNAKIGRIGSDYDARNSSGENIGADFWQTYYGLSAEFGYKVDLTNRFFLEPQAQMQVLRIEGSNFTTEGGVKAEIDDANSLIGRLGLRAGYSFSFAESLPASSVYAVADVLREFKGDTVLRAIGRSTFYEYDESGRETWFDAGIGADLSVNRTMNLWLDTKYVFGGDFENTWSLNAGVRWIF